MNISCGYIEEGAPSPAHKCQENRYVCLAPLSVVGLGGKGTFQKNIINVILRQPKGLMSSMYYLKGHVVLLTTEE